MLFKQAIQRIPVRGIRICIVIAGYLAVLFFAAWQIHSYVVAQDTHLHYFNQARAIIESGWSPATVKQIAHVFSPGYPLLLAVLMKVWGEYATWVNVVFGLLWVLGLALLLLRMTKSHLAVALGLGSWFVLLILHYPLNAHYFLYPFRDGPAQTCMLWAFLALLLPARPRVFLAGLLLVAGMAIREVAVVGLPVALFFLIVQVPASSRGERWRRVGYLLAPFAFACLLVLVVSAGGNWQVRRMLGAFAAFQFDAGRELAASLLQGPRWLVPVLWLAGGVALWRWPRLLLWLVLPAVCTWLVYGVHVFHPRYALSLLLWLAPLPGLGLCAALHCCPKPVARYIGLVAAGGLFAASVVVASRLVPWGVQVPRADVKAFRRAFQEGIDPGDIVIPERDCLLGQAAVGSYTAAIHSSLDSVRHRKRLGKRVFLLQAVNEAAKFEQRRSKEDGIRLAELVLRSHDLHEHIDSLRLGSAVYRLLEVRDRTDVQRRDVLPLTPGWDHWVLLDFRQQEEGADHTLSLDHLETPLRTWTMERRDGIQFLRIPKDLAKAKAMTLYDESSLPGPDPFVVGVLPQGSPFRFDGTDLRSLSFLRWFRGAGWVRGKAHDRYGLGLAGEAEVVVPLPLDEALQAVHVHFDFQTLSKATGCPVEVLHEGRTITRMFFSGQRSRHVLKVRVAEPAGPELRLVLRPTRPEAFPFSGLRSLYVSFEPAPADGL